MEHIKNYKSDTKSFNSGQALKCGYDYDKTKIVIKEMTEEVIRRLIATDMVAEGIHLHISYDWKSTADGTYSGPTQVNYYGRKAPVSARGTTKLGGPTACPSRIMKATLELFEKIIDPKLSRRKLYVTAIRLSNREDVPPQLGFFVDTSAEDREIALVKAMLRVQDRFGKSAVFKCYDLLDGATTLERNEQIGGHKANG